MVSIASAIYINSLISEVVIDSTTFYNNSAIVIIIKAMYGNIILFNLYFINFSRDII